MSLVIFNETKLKVLIDKRYGTLFPTSSVAVGYGCTPDTIRHNQKNHFDELIEGVHYIIDRSYRNTPKTMWTLDGVHMLGFFIKSEQAKTFRMYVAKLLTEIREGRAKITQNKNDIQLERENIELRRALNRLLKQPTPTCEELLKLHYPVLHNNILELNNTFKNIDTAALQRFVFFIDQVQKNVATLAQGLKEDRKRRS